MCDLLDDEIEEVQTAALTNFFDFLQQCTVQEMQTSLVISTFRKLFT